MRACVCWLVFVMCGACLTDPAALEYETVIYGGAADAAHPSVGQVVADLGGAKGYGCSGTAISSGPGVPPSHVLTARHCVQIPVDNTLVTPFSIAVTWGNEKIATTDWQPHQTSDIAVLRLVTQPGVVAAQVAGPSAQLTKGQEVVYVGFGSTSATGRPGSKFAGTSTVVGLNAAEGAVAANLPPERQAAWLQTGPTAFGEHLFYTTQGAAHCVGDSGGPAFSGNTVVGVISHGLNQDISDCPAGASGNVTVAPLSQWIQTAMQTGAQPLPPAQPNPGLPSPRPVSPPSALSEQAGGCSTGTNAPSNAILWVGALAWLFGAAPLRRRTRLHLRR